MITSHTLSNVRLVAFAIAGTLCAAYALSALIHPAAPIVPDWLPITAGALAGVVFFVAGILAGPRVTSATLDESYQSEHRTAGFIGFWVAIVSGVGLWQTGLGGQLQLAENRVFVPSTTLALKLAQTLGTSVHDLFELPPISQETPE